MNVILDWWIWAFFLGSVVILAVASNANSTPCLCGFRFFVVFGVLFGVVLLVGLCSKRCKGWMKANKARPLTYFHQAGLPGFLSLVCSWPIHQCLCCTPDDGWWRAWQMQWDSMERALLRWNFRNITVTKEVHFYQITWTKSLTKRGNQTSGWQNSWWTSWWRVRCIMGL